MLFLTYLPFCVVSYVLSHHTTAFNYEGDPHSTLSYTKPVLVRLNQMRQGPCQSKPRCGPNNRNETACKAGSRSAAKSSLVWFVCGVKTSGPYHLYIPVYPSADREICSVNNLIINLWRPCIFLCISFGNHGNNVFTLSSWVFYLINRSRLLIALSVH